MEDGFIYLEKPIALHYQQHLLNYTYIMRKNRVPPVLSHYGIKDDQ